MKILWSSVVVVVLLLTGHASLLYWNKAVGIVLNLLALGIYLAIERPALEE